MHRRIDRRFLTITAAVALAVTAIVNGPMFLGKIPFPAFFLYEYPAYAPQAPSGQMQVPANIGDLVTSFYPFRALAARAVKNGEMPLWNPYMLSGTPLLANAQSAVFYPLTLPYYFLPTPIAWAVGFVVRPFLLILFMAIFVRSIGGTTAGSIAAALLFTFCGFNTAWQGQAMSDALLWLPLACFAVVRLHQEPSGKLVALATFVFAMPVLAGHPETAAHVTLVVATLAAFLMMTNPSRRFAFHFVAAGVLSIALTAVQLLPTLEWLRFVFHSLRDPWPSQPLWGLLGWVSRDVLDSTNSFGLQIPEQATYIGMIAFAAAPLAFLNRSGRKFAVFCLFWIVASLSIAYGVGPFFWIARSVPVLQALKNSRMIFITAFSLAVLAGLGISELESWTSEEIRKRRWRAATLMLAGSAVALTLIYVLRLVTVAMSESSRYPRVSALLLMLSAVTILVRLSGHMSPAFFSSAALVILCVDVVSFSYGFMPFTDMAHVFPRFEIFDKLPPGNERIAQVGLAYTENTQSVYGLSAVGGYEVCLRRIKLFLEGLSGPEIDTVWFVGQPVLDAKDRRLDMLNAKYLIVTEWDPDYRRFREQPDRYRLLSAKADTDVYENLKALPPAFVVPESGIEIIGDERRSIERIKDAAFDPERSVILSEPLAAAREPAMQSASTVEWTSRRLNSFEMNVTAGSHGVLVVSQTFYPGWVAFVDGQRVPVVPADYALTGIEIPTGKHQVRFEFQSPSFRWGLLISALSVVLSVGLIRGRRAARNPRRAPDSAS